MADHVSGDIEQGAKKAVQTAQKTARAAKSVQAAATKVASGNYVGAAKDVLANETTRNIIIFLIIFSIFLTIFIFFIAPLSLYESIVSAAEALAEKWRVAYYEGTSGRFVSTFRALIGLFKNDDVDSALSKSTEAGDEDKASSEDLKLMGEEDALKATYARKIKAVQDKINSREEIIKDQIESKYGSINSYFAGRYESEYAHMYDDDEFTRISYGGTSLDVITRTLNDKQALNILSLYSTQIGSSVDNIKLSGLLKWLGYNAGGSKNIEFDIDSGHRVQGSVKAWTGTFLPQYLIDEAVQRNELEKYQKDYGCSVADFLIRVNAPDFASISAITSERIVTESRDNWIRIPIVYMTYPGAADEVKPWFNSAVGRFVYPRDCLVQYGGNYTYVYNSAAGIYVPARVSGSPAIGIPSVAWVYVNVPYEVEIKEITVSYSVPISISTRSPKEILDVVGLWEGWLPSEPFYEDSKAA